MLLVGERFARLGEVAEVVPGDGRLEPGRPEAGPHRLHGLEGMRQVDVLGGLEGVLVELPEWQLLCRRGADHHAERRGGEQAASDAFHRSEEHTAELQSIMRITYAVFGFKKKR